MTTTTTKRFSGLAFPLITVRLGSNKGTATMHIGTDLKRASLAYDYSQPDGEQFAVKVAEKLWDDVLGADSDNTVLVPCDLGPGKGYGFTAVPSYFFEPTED